MSNKKRLGYALAALGGVGVALVGLGLIGCSKSNSGSTSAQTSSFILTVENLIKNDTNDTGTPGPVDTPVDSSDTETPAPVLVS
jgi:hypothetical protein